MVGLPRESRISRARTATISDIGRSFSRGEQTLITVCPSVNPLTARQRWSTCASDTKGTPQDGSHRAGRRPRARSTIRLGFYQEVNMLVRWTPFNEMARLQQDIDRLFG